MPCCWVQLELALHLLLFVDRLPPLCIAAGLVSHVTYARLLKRFPYISFTSANGAMSTGGWGSEGGGSGAAGGSAVYGAVWHAAGNTVRQACLGRAHG